MQTTRTDWGRRQPPIGGSSFELQAWFFMRVSGLVLVFLAVWHMFCLLYTSDAADE